MKHLAFLKISKQARVIINNNPSSRFCYIWQRSARKGPYVLCPICQHYPQGCPRNSANISLVERRSLTTSEGGMSAVSFRWSMLWCSGLSVFRKFLNPPKTSALRSCIPDAISAVFLSISADSFSRTPACPGLQFHRRLCMGVCQSGQPIPDSNFSNRFEESVIMAYVICASRLEDRYCIESVTASVSMVEFRGHHCLCVRSLQLSWLWTPNQSAPLWLSRPCRLRCHVACPCRLRCHVACPCRLRCHVACFRLLQSFVLLHCLFQLAIHSSGFLESLAAESRGRAWTQLGVFCFVLFFVSCFCFCFCLNWFQTQSLGTIQLLLDIGDCCADVTGCCADVTGCCADVTGCSVNKPVILVQRHPVYNLLQTGTIYYRLTCVHGFHTGFFFFFSSNILV